MRTAEALYAAYRIHSGLRRHQLRVAAVAQMICDSIVPPVDTRSVVVACLLHDMGNIIKSDFVKLPHMFEPEGMEYWKGVQREFVEQYGDDVHAATGTIAREIGVSETVVSYIDGIGFSNIEDVRDGASYEMKIVQYADTRVAPDGIVSQAARSAEARERYRGVGGTDEPEGEGRYLELVAAAGEIERQIFARCSITPESITEESAGPIVEKLRTMEIV